MSSSHLMVMRLLGEVSAAFRTLAASLRQRVTVTRVDEVCDPRVTDEGASIEWFVDAELASGQALSWHLLVYWSAGEWIIESDVRRIGAGGSDAEVELPKRFALDDDLQIELVSAASALIRTEEKIDFGP